MLHHMNHGGATDLQYLFSSKIKGSKGALVLALANLVLQKLVGLRTPLPNRPKWDMSTWAPHLSSSQKMALGSSFTKPSTGLATLAGIIGSPGCKGLTFSP